MKGLALTSKEEATAKVEGQRVKRKKMNDGSQVAAGASVTEKGASMFIGDGHRDASKPVVGP